MKYREEIKFFLYLFAIAIVGLLAASISGCKKSENNPIVPITIDGEWKGYEQVLTFTSEDSVSVTNDSTIWNIMDDGWYNMYYIENGDTSTSDSKRYEVRGDTLFLSFTPYVIDYLSHKRLTVTKYRDGNSYKFKFNRI